MKFEVGDRVDSDHMPIIVSWEGKERRGSHEEEGKDRKKKEEEWKIAGMRTL